MPDGNRVTRWIVLAALILATAVIFLVSLRGNYLYGHSLGQSEEKRTLFAWANVGADVWKAFGLIAIGLLWRAKQWRAAFIGGFAWLMCLIFGLNSALGIYVDDRSTLTGTRAASHLTYEEKQEQLAELEALVRKRTPTHSVGEITTAIESVLATAVIVSGRARGTVGTLSRDCTRLDVRTESACAKVRALRSELAAAREGQRLNDSLTGLRREVSELRDAGASVAADPIGEFYAWLTGGFVSVRDVGFGFPLFFALLIEAVSAFGPATIAAYAEATRSRESPHLNDVPGRAVASRDTPWHAPARPSATDDGDVIFWIAERAVPTGGSRAVGVDALHADYLNWCEDKQIDARGIDDFERAFDRVRELPELAGKIRKFSARYYGIALITERRSIAAGKGR